MTIVAIVGVLAGTVAAIFAVMSYFRSGTANRIAREAQSIALESLSLAREQAQKSPEFRVSFDLTNETSSRNVFMVIRFENIGSLPAKNMDARLQLPNRAFGFARRSDSAFMEHVEERAKNQDIIYKSESSGFGGFGCELEFDGFERSPELRLNMWIGYSVGVQDSVSFGVVLWSKEIGTFDLPLKITSDEGLLFDDTVELTVA